jgi:hypothetical protein
MKTILLLSIALSLNACMTTSAIRSHAEGEDGREPKPALKALYLLTVPIDVVTFPFQFIYIAYALDSQING